MQVALAKLLKLDKTIGYYFATYFHIKNNLDSIKGHHSAYGFYRDKISPNDKNDMYIKYALIIETLFLNNKGSFIKFNSKGSKLIPCFVPTSNEVPRLKFVNLMQKGILDFTKDFMFYIRKLRLQNDFSNLINYDVCARLFNMLKYPTIGDSKIFESVTIENYYSGRNLRFIVAPNSQSDSVSIWKEGNALLNGISTRKQNNYSTNIFVKYIAKLGIIVFEYFYLKLTPNSNRFHKKLLKNRVLFYLDSKVKFLKIVWRLSNS